MKHHIVKSISSTLHNRPFKHNVIRVEFICGHLVDWDVYRLNSRKGICKKCLKIAEGEK